MTLFGRLFESSEHSTGNVANFTASQFWAAHAMPFTNDERSGSFFAIHSDSQMVNRYFVRDGICAMVRSTKSWTIILDLILSKSETFRLILGILRQAVLSDIGKSYVTLFCEQITPSSQIAGFGAKFVKKVLDNSN
jgi:hypothetical protein